MHQHSALMNNYVVKNIELICILSVEQINTSKVMVTYHDDGNTNIQIICHY